MSDMSDGQGIFIRDEENWIEEPTAEPKTSIVDLWGCGVRPTPIYDLAHLEIPDSVVNRRR